MIPFRVKFEDEIIFSVICDARTLLPLHPLLFMDILPQNDPQERHIPSVTSIGSAPPLPPPYAYLYIDFALNVMSANV